ncbi:MAG: homoserine kinase [Myxococcota bacterium]
MRITASAAASVSNLGPGYDVLGLCLESPRDRVTVERTDSGVVELVEVSGDGGRLPRVAEENCASIAAQRVLEQFGPPGAGVRLWLEKGLPLGSGLGSSGASAVAAALATSALVSPETPRELLLSACREGERHATGSPHPDNVAPSLLGGLVACVPRPTTEDTEAIEVVQLPIVDGLWIAAVKPDVEVRTADARAALPTHIPMADVVANLGAMASLVAGLATGDLAQVGRALTDRIATPYRRGLIPGYDAVVTAAVEAGAVGAGISGSGPTVFALVDGAEAAVHVAEVMVRAFGREGHAAMTVLGAVDPVGARIEVR